MSENLEAANEVTTDSETVMPGASDSLESPPLSEEPMVPEVVDPIRLALTWFTLCIAIVMTGFTGADLGSGDQATSLWIGMAAWPIIAIIAGYSIRGESRDRR